MSHNQPRWSQEENCYVYPNGYRLYPAPTQTQQWPNAPNQSLPQQVPPQNLQYVPRGQPSRPDVQHARNPSSSSHGSANYQWRPQAVPNQASGASYPASFSGPSQYPTPPTRPQLPRPVKPLRRNIEGTDGDYEPLDPHYTKHGKDFFKLFRVFMMLWSQPADDSALSIVTKEVTRDKRFGQAIYSKIRRFIVVTSREGDDKCICIPIVTYDGHGVGKNVVKSEHAIVHTSPDAPKPTIYERPRKNEKPMRIPIRVRTDERGDKLSEMSRIDYGRVYTIEKNVKVKPFGWIHEHSRKDLEYSFHHVFLGDAGFKVWREDREGHDRRQRDPVDESGEDDKTDEESDEEDEGDGGREQSREEVDAVNRSGVVSPTSKGKAPVRDPTSLAIRTRSIPTPTRATQKASLPVLHTRSQNVPTMTRRLPQQGQGGYARTMNHPGRLKHESEEEDNDEEDEDDEEEDGEGESDDE